LSGWLLENGFLMPTRSHKAQRDGTIHHPRSEIASRHEGACRSSSSSLVMQSFVTQFLGRKSFINKRNRSSVIDFPGKAFFGWRNKQQIWATTNSFHSLISVSKSQLPTTRCHWGMFAVHVNGKIMLADTKARAGEALVPIKR